MRRGKDSRTTVVSACSEHNFVCAVNLFFEEPCWFWFACYVTTAPMDRGLQQVLLEPALLMLQLVLPALPHLVLL